MKWHLRPISRRDWFLLAGYQRTYSPKARREPDETNSKIAEPKAAKACRRNILALAGIITATGFAGADPDELTVLGMKFQNNAPITLWIAIVVLQGYWYWARFLHLKEDGIVEELQFNTHEYRYTKMRHSTHFPLMRKNADLQANRIALFMSFLSVATATSWLF